LKFTDDEFKRLQKEWYQKLKEQGFKDIETLSRNGLRLKNEHRRFFRTRGERDRDMWQQTFIDAKTDYFIRLTHKINDPHTVFRNEMDRIAMTLYSDGFNCVQITNFLAAFGYNRRRKAIVYLIRRYEDAWGLKNYNRKQLNRRPTKKDQATSQELVTI